MDNIDIIYARWLSGELSPEEERALKASGEWEELEAIIKATDELALPSYQVDEAYFKFHLQKKEEKVSSLRNRILWASGIAAGLCLFLYFLLNSSSNNLIEYQTLATETLSKTLPDGSEVQLNDGSTLSFDVSNWEADRTLDLAGEAQFKVEKGSVFSVQTANGIVEVLGTQFNVRARGNSLRVECYEGKVRVSAGSEESSLSAGTSVRVIAGVFEGIQQIDRTEPSWVNGTSTFAQENLDQVFEELARQYGVTIKKSSLNKRFSGSFTHDNLELALQQVCKPMGLNCSLSEDQKIVTILE